MSQTIAGQDYLDVGEAAALLGVKRATLYAYVSRGLLRSHKQGVGRKRLYLRAEVEALRAVRASESGAEAAEHALGGAELPSAASWAGDH